MSGSGPFFCKSPKVHVTIFSAKRQNKPQSPIDIHSSRSPKSPVSSARDDVGPHMFIRTSRPRLGNFVIKDAKRLLQQYRSRTASLTIEPAWQLNLR
jgi:hypothetical protein